MASKRNRKSMRLNFKKLRANAILPTYGSTNAAGMDLYAALDEPFLINPGQFKSIPTGLAVSIPNNYEGQIRPRSGLAFKEQIFAFAGTIDSDFRGEIAVLLENRSDKPFAVKPGDRIAQMVISPYTKSVNLFDLKLDETERGSGGFGSTGA